MRQLSFPCLITSSIAGMNEKTSNDKYNTRYTEENSQCKGEFFEEITGQADGKNGGTQRVNAFSDEFSSGIISGCFHRFNDNMIGNVCQTQFLRSWAPELRIRTAKKTFSRRILSCVIFSG